MATSLGIALGPEQTEQLVTTDTAVSGARDDGEQGETTLLRGRTSDWHSVLREAHPSQKTQSQHVVRRNGIEIPAGKGVCQVFDGSPI